MSVTFVPGRPHPTPCGGGAQQEGGGGPGGILQSRPELPQLASDPYPLLGVFRDAAGRPCSNGGNEPFIATSARAQLYGQRLLLNNGRHAWGYCELSIKEGWVGGGLCCQQPADGGDYFRLCFVFP